jgi:serine/threonine-protein kinase PknK
VLRTELKDAIRFRLLDTLREYGRAKIEETAEFQDLRRRHLDWYRGLVGRAGAEWFGPNQLAWIERLEPERYNVSEALKFAIPDTPQIAVEMTGHLFWYGIARGALSQTRRWLDRALAVAPAEPTTDRIKALYAASVLAGAQGDVSGATALAAEARTLATQNSDPVADGYASLAEGFAALLVDDFDRVSACIAAPLAASDPIIRLAAMMLQGWALQFRGEIGPALIWQEKALATSEAAGEVVFRSILLWSIGVGWWRHGKSDRAEELLRQCLELAHGIDDPRNAAACMEAMAWIAGAKSQPKRAAVLMAAAEKLGHLVGASPAVLPDLVVFHEECERRTREELGSDAYTVALRDGRSLDFDQAVAYAVNRQTRDDEAGAPAT